MSTVVPAWYFALAMGVFGLLFGSFANVVIWRVPRGESIAHPGSHCPGCDAPIAWYDNIPVLSWLVLRGRCRNCSEPIAIRYPLVEAASGALFLLGAITWGPSVRALFGGALFWFLLVLSMIDIDHMRLPNPIVGMVALVGLIGALLSQLLSWQAVPLVGVGASGLAAQPLAMAAIGLLLGVGLPAAIALAYRLIRGTSGFGMGDVKLLGALGVFLGPYVLLNVFISSLFGAAWGIVSRGSEGLAQRRIPFGPWLAVGALLTATLGEVLWSAYRAIAGL